MSEKVLFAIRAIARAAAVVMTAAFLFLVIAEVATERSSMPANRAEWLGVILLGIASFSLLLAFKWEWQGAILSLLAIGLFARLIAQKTDIVLWMASIPAWLFIADWVARQFTPPHTRRTV